MSADAARHLEPVGSDFRRVETVSRELRETQVPVYGPGAAASKRPSLWSEGPELVQVAAALLWQGWLILAGTVVGVIALAVLLRVAVAVIRWSI